jgi:putative colanic acid biosynthesis acetyltransferase WcaF
VNNILPEPGNVESVGSDADEGSSYNGSVRIDTVSNRRAKKYELREQVLRVLWIFGVLLFRMSPRPLFGWRRFILRLFGARVGADVHVYSSATIYMPWNIELDDFASIGEHAYIYNLGKVHIGKSATVSYRAHICAGTHDFEDPACPLLKPPVTIEDGAWIGTDAFIGPNVVVGRNAMVGARAVVFKSVSANHVVIGNPAKAIRIRGSNCASKQVKVSS